MLSVRVDGESVQFEYAAPGIEQAAHRVYLAIESGDGVGSSIVPFGRGWEGSTTFLPFTATDLFSVINSHNGAEISHRRWHISEWGAWGDAGTVISGSYAPGRLSFTVSPAALGNPATLGFALYAKDLTQNDGWGVLYGASDPAVTSGYGDQFIAGYNRITLGESPALEYRTRLETPSRVRIYQLMVRLFGNVNPTRKPNGTLAENGCGKFDDINDAALDSIRGLGCTHLWLTGALRQATATDYTSIGLPADVPDLLKGLAGSPYAIKDYFDVCPDYANAARHRLEEFKALLGRIHAHGLKAIIDLVPNHVARSYASTVRPECSFGAMDDVTRFFDPDNNFFYLRPTDHGGGPPLKLPTVRDGHPISPTCKVLGAGSGVFQPEAEHGRVTGNNAVTWAPGLDDWYETVKLNYGHDFTRPGERVYPLAATPDAPIPATWRVMDEIIEYWQEIGVDGFRCDMSHMVPAEFWGWAIARARARQPHVWFMAEAYDADPAKLPPADPVAGALNNVMFSLLNAGFNAVYDDPSYKALKAIYDGPRWANDFDGAITSDFVYQNSVRYAENHDEVRLAGSGNWGGIGMEVGRPVAAILYAIGRGPLMLYSGQEVGEPGGGNEGYCRDAARTTIFDYWSMPELSKWVNHHLYDGGQLSEEQCALRRYYARLLELTDEPGLRFGSFYPLNAANLHSQNFGVVDGDPASGHWMYAFLRHDVRSGQGWLIVANLHRNVAFSNVRIRVPKETLERVGISEGRNVAFTDRLQDTPVLMASHAELSDAGLLVPRIPALSAMYLEIG